MKKLAKKEVLSRCVDVLDRREQEVKDNLSSKVTEIQFLGDG